ncbi:MAG: antibiotic biosynthesis monooxygenase [Saprospiraceae bacterium]
MKFGDENLNNFVQIFRETAPRIKNFSGCISVELVQDVKDKNQIFTISEWESEESLEQYRNSDFFSITWKKTKLLFVEKAVAWSLSKIV